MTDTTTPSSPPLLVVPPIVAEAQALAPVRDAYPEGRYPSPRRMGQFDKLQLGGFVVAPEDQLATRRYFGLRHTDTFFDVLLTGASGTFYMVSNAVRDGADGTLAATPWLGAYRSSPGGLVPDERYTPWSGGITQRLSTDGVVTYALDDGSESFSFGATSFEWGAGGGVAHLTGTLAGNGTSWRLPWREPGGDTGEMFYNQQGYRVEGEFFGEAVTGHVVLETMWGNDDYVETWWVRNRIGHWAFFVNSYADGSSEFGQVLCGEFGARGAVVVGDQGNEVLNTTAVNAYEDPDGTVRYEFGDGELWTFVLSPERAMPSFGTTKLLIGAATRVDETREIVAASAVGLIADRMGAPEVFAAPA